VFDGALNGAITGLAGALVIGLLFLIGYLLGGGAKKTADGTTVLRYGGAFRAVGLLGVVIALVMAALLLLSLLGVGPGEDARLPILLMLGLFGLLGAPLTVEAYRRRVVLDDDGLTARGWFGTRPLVRWEDVASVENKVMSGKFVVRAGRVKLSLGHYLDGLDVFAAECKARLAPEVYGKAFEKPINRPFL
jgi:hypothetical protein